MKIRIITFGLCILLAGAIAGCDAVQAFAPPPQATLVPTPTTVISTQTPLPTMGALEYMDAAYCLVVETENKDAEYNLLVFYLSGVVLEMTVQGQSGCEESWDHSVKDRIPLAFLGDTYTHPTNLLNIIAPAS